MPIRYGTLEERFKAKYRVDAITGCWLWVGAIGAHCYGHIKSAGKAERAHRVSWELHNGPIPKSDGHNVICVLHKCDTPTCVNPGHLFLGTQADNMADRDAKGRQAKGEGAGTARLTMREVVEIRRKYANGTVTQKYLADEFSISQTTVSEIVTCKTYKL